MICSQTKLIGVSSRDASGYSIFCGDLRALEQDLYLARLDPLRILKSNIQNSTCI